MKRITQILLAAVVAGGISNACNKSSSFGSEILPSEDDITIRYTDTLSIEASSEKRDSIITYSETLQFSNNLCGEIYDPIFGLSHSQVYAQLRRGSSTDSARFDGAILDSVIMRVAFSESTRNGLRRHFFDNDKTAGNVGFGASIYRLQDTLDRDFTYYSNKSLAVKEKLGRFIIPDFDPYINPNSTRDRFYEFNLNADQLWEDMQNHSDKVFTSDRILSQVLAGIAIIPTPTDFSGKIEGMAALDLGGRTNLIFHFHKDTATYFQILTVNTNSARTMNFEQRDSMGLTSMVSTYSADPSLSDELVFLEGLSGWDVKLEFPNLEDLGSIAVNNATLELIVKDVPELLDKDHPAIILGSYESNSGRFNIIQDVVGASGGILSSYGGVKKYRHDSDGNVEVFYSINISKHLQRVVNGDFVNPALYISVFNKQESAARVVLGGAKNPDIGMKLKLTYSNL